MPRKYPIEIGSWTDAQLDERNIELQDEKERIRNEQREIHQEHTKRIRAKTKGESEFVIGAGDIGTEESVGALGGKE